MEKYNFIDNAENVQDIIDWVLKQSTVAIDTETTGLDPLTSKILLLQIGTPHKQYVIDTVRVGENKIKQLLNCINQPQITKILHNSIFDYMQIKTNYGISLNNIKCTMLGEQLLNQGKKDVAFSLAGVTKKYTGYDLEKSVRSTFQDHRYGDKFSIDQITYAAKDVEYLIPIYNSIQKLIIDRGMKELFLLENETAAVLGNMSLDGIYLDKTLWVPLEEKAVVGLVKYKEKLDEHFKYYIEANSSLNLFGEEAVVINYNSPQQLLPRLLEITKLPLTSTDAKQLEYFKNSHEVIADLLNYRQEQKKISTYGLAFLDNIHKFDNRIHSKYRQLKAQTGRISSDNPNMMNLPKEQDYRTPFGVQDPTWNFISADFSGQDV